MHVDPYDVRVTATEQSAAARVAADLRARILRGDLAPGAQLSERVSSAATGASRNTVREAYRLLSYDGLVVHEQHRGVFVRRPGAAEAHQIYQARRLLEVSVVREVAVLRAIGREDQSSRAATGWAERVAAVTSAATAGRRAAQARRWAAVGTADLRLHLAIGGLLGNPDIDRALEVALTGMRLIFALAGSAREVHERYVEPNQGLAALVQAAAWSRLAVELETYLLRAEQHTVAWYSERLSTLGGKR